MGDGLHERQLVIKNWHGESDDKILEVTHPKVGDWKGIVGAFAVIMYSYAVAEMMPTIYSDMAKPRTFNLGAGVAHGVAFAVYVGVCTIAFCAYGSAAGADGVDTITTIMNSTACKVAVSITLIIHIFVDIPVWLNPVSIAIERRLQAHVFPKAKPFVVQIIVRACVVASTVGFGMIGKKVVSLMGIAGAVTTNCTCVLFPNLFFFLCKREIARLDQKMKDEGVAHVTTELSDRVFLKSGYNLDKSKSGRSVTSPDIIKEESVKLIGSEQGATLSQNDRDDLEVINDIIKQESVKLIGSEEGANAQNSKRSTGSDEAGEHEIRPEEVTRCQPNGYVSGDFSWLRKNLTNKIFGYTARWKFGPPNDQNQFEISHFSLNCHPKSNFALGLSSHRLSLLVPSALLYSVWALTLPSSISSRSISLFLRFYIFTK